MGDRKQAVLVCGPRRADELGAKLRDAGWQFQALTALEELWMIDPDDISCFILDSSCQPLVDDVLGWCEEREEWQLVTKWFVVPAATDYSNLFAVPADDLPSRLGIGRRKFMDAPGETPGLQSANSSAQGAATGAERRRYHRHRLFQPVRLEYEVMMVDLSAGGMALETNVPLEAGTRVRVHLAENDAILAGIEAQVVGCQQRRGTAHSVHLSFAKVNSNLERALQRYLLALHAKRSGNWQGVSAAKSGITPWR
jgi:hypothetical protein